MFVAEGIPPGVGYEWLVYEVDKPGLPMLGTGYRLKPELAKRDAAAELERHTDALAIVTAVARECHIAIQQPEWNGEISLVGVCVKGGIKWMAGTRRVEAVRLLRLRRGLRQL